MKYLNVFKKQIILSVVSILALPIFAFAVTFDNPLVGVNSLGDLLNEILDFLFVIAGPIITIMVLYAAFLFMTSSGDPKKVDAAKKTLFYIVIGVVVLLLSKAMVGLINSFLQ